MERPPGPKGIALLGNLEAFEKDRLGFLTECSRTYGSMVRYSDQMYFINDSALLEEVLKRTNEDYFVAFDVFQKRVSNEHLHAFMQYRQVALRGLKRSLIQNFIPQVIELVDESQKGWWAGEELEVLRTMEHLTGTVIAQYCFGEDSEGIPEMATDLLDALVLIIGNPVLFPEWVPTPTNLRIRRRAARFQRKIGQIIQARRARTPSTEDLLGQLLWSDWPSNQPTDERLMHALTGTILAAHRVPAAALSWTLYLLGSHNKVEQTASEEAKRIFANRSLKDIELSDFPYLECVVKEALRLYPPTWLNERQVMRDCELGGYPLRKGQEVIFSAYVLHRDPRYYHDSERFVPERWLPGYQDKPRSAYAYIPFGAGPRVCIGASLSTTVITITVARILLKYRLELIDGHKVQPDPRNTLLPSNLRLRVHPRARSTTASSADLNHTAVPAQCPFR